MTSQGTGPHVWGVRPAGGGKWRFALWAPKHEAIGLHLRGTVHPMSRGQEGVHALICDAAPGDAYGFTTNGRIIADPASRLQQDGVDGLSIVTAPRPLPEPWAGLSAARAIILELHIGTFTEEGTFAAAAQRLPDLAALGITAVEIMPVAHFAGARGWGYDGVLPYAPHPAYGTPDDLAAFVAAAHAAGIAVILDVVYNHFGPVGAPLPQICPSFFDAGRDTPWGQAINLDRRPVREFFIQNAEMWVREFGIDGLRLDAVHQLRDSADPDFVSELAMRVRALEPGRPLLLIAEDERNLTAHRDAGHIDAEWNDDYHHAVHCLLTGEDEGYYAAFAVDPVGDLARALADGQVRQGQSRGGNEPPGAPSAHLPPTAFINANQTHDQIGNRALGERLISLAGPQAMRIAHALLLTSPAIPMLFMGEEAGARTPFPFFADYTGRMAEAVRKGRASEFAAFSGFDGALPDPLDPATLASARPYAAPSDDAEAWLALTRQLLRWRHDHVVPLLMSGKPPRAEVRVTGPRALHARWSFGEGTIETVARFGCEPSKDQPGPGNALRTLTLGDEADRFYFSTWISQR